MPRTERLEGLPAPPCQNIWTLFLLFATFFFSAYVLNQVHCQISFSWDVDFHCCTTLHLAHLFIYVFCGSSRFCTSCYKIKKCLFIPVPPVRSGRVFINWFISKQTITGQVHSCHISDEISTGIPKLCSILLPFHRHKIIPSHYGCNFWHDTNSEKCTCFASVRIDILEENKLAYTA